MSIKILVIITNNPK